MEDVLGQENIRIIPRRRSRKKTAEENKTKDCQSHLLHQNMKFEMDTIQLSRILSNMPVKGEACANDLLPDRKPLHTKAYIVNTDLSDDPGEHWVAVYFRENRVIYFYSYGMPPDIDYILPFIKRNSSGWIQNSEMLQDPWSKTCEMWCIYIINQLNRG